MVPSERCRPRPPTSPSLHDPAPHCYQLGWPGGHRGLVDRERSPPPPQTYETQPCTMSDVENPVGVGSGAVKTSAQIELESTDKAATRECVGRCFGSLCYCCVWFCAAMCGKQEE